jgi:hypothetical protein
LKGISVAPNVLLTNEDRELLTKVGDLLEEVVETVNVLEKTKKP